jgi:ribonuclease HII
MQRAVKALPIVPTQVWVDGNKSPDFGLPSRAIVKGDLTEPAISAASILAKVIRDREMMELELQYPGYGFAQHKGYPTAQHRAALQSLGLTPIHRRSYAPVQRLLF